MPNPKPLTLTSPQVRAIQAGATLLCWPVKPQPPEGADCPLIGSYGVDFDYYGSRTPASKSPCQPGEERWVRETWLDYCPLWDGYWCGHGTVEGMAKDHKVVYRATNPTAELTVTLKNGETVTTHGRGWKKATAMPRWASRYTLRIGEVRVKRVKEVTEEEAIAMGCVRKNFNSARDDLYLQWSAKHGPGSWESNPWVFVISFRQVNKT